MTLEQVKTLLEAAGLPVAYRAFPVSAAPPLPFIVFLETGARNTGADGRVYYSARQIVIELYTATKDPATESRVEAALAELYYEKDETYLDDEQCFEVLYRIEV